MVSAGKERQVNRLGIGLLESFRWVLGQGCPKLSGTWTWSDKVREMVTHEKFETPIKELVGPVNLATVREINRKRYQLASAA